jgi:hypothetical protein
MRGYYAYRQRATTPKVKASRKSAGADAHRTRAPAAKAASRRGVSTRRGGHRSGDRPVSAEPVRCSRDRDGRDSRRGMDRDAEFDRFSCRPPRTCHSTARLPCGPADCAPRRCWPRCRAGRGTDRVRVPNCHDHMDPRCGHRPLADRQQLGPQPRPDDHRSRLRARPRRYCRRVQHLDHYDSEPDQRREPDDLRRLPLAVRRPDRSQGPHHHEWHLRRRGRRVDRRRQVDVERRHVAGHRPTRGGRACRLDGRHQGRGGHPAGARWRGCG